MVTRMEQLPAPPDSSLIEQAGVLNNCYVPTRYPHGDSPGTTVFSVTDRSERISSHYAPCDRCIRGY